MIFTKWFNSQYIFATKGTSWIFRVINISNLYFSYITLCFTFATCNIFYNCKFTTYITFSWRFFFSSFSFFTEINNRFKFWHLHLRRFKMVHFRNDNFIINLKVGHSLIPCKFWVSLILKELTGRLNRRRSNATECPQEYTWGNYKHYFL